MKFFFWHKPWIDPWKNPVTAFTPYPYKAPHITNTRNVIRVLSNHDNYSTAGWRHNAKNRNIITQCGRDRLLGGFGVAGKGVFFERTFKLPRHSRVTVTFRGYSIDSWDNEKYNVWAGGKDPIKINF